MTPKALGDYIIAKPIKREEVEETKSGILVVNEERKRDGDVVYLCVGEILSIGEGVDVTKMNLKIGQQVLYSPYDRHVFVDAKTEYHTVPSKFIEGTISTD